jgi:hypothetical protein
MACLALCQANGERMATTGEALAWASKGQNSCAYMWMIDPSSPYNPMRGYPMYSNRTTPGCGSTHTGDVPRLEGLGAATWDSTSEYNCGCSTLN